MRTNLDFSPLYRSSIGFERVFSLLENANHLQAVDNWPPYDIAKAGEDAYRITIAVAAFAEDELSVAYAPNLLVVSGTKPENDEAEYLHHGLSNRSFTRRFELADYVKVVGAGLDNGLLTIDLERELPEEMRPRRISIQAEPLAKTATKRLEREVGTWRASATGKHAP